MAAEYYKFKPDMLKSSHCSCKDCESELCYDQRLETEKFPEDHNESKTLMYNSQKQTYSLALFNDPEDSSYVNLRKAIDLKDEFRMQLLGDLIYDCNESKHVNPSEYSIHDQSNINIRFNSDELLMTDFEERSNAQIQSISYTGFNKVSKDIITEKASPEPCNGTMDFFKGSNFKFDLLQRIKEVYNACSCKVCECIIGKAFPMRKFQYGYDENVDNPCQCKPCECVDCTHIYLKKNSFIVASLAEQPLNEASCTCAPCNCMQCRNIYLSNTTNTTHEMSTGLDRHPYCHCDLCTNESCEPDGTETCKCHRQTKVVTKPVEKDVRDYDIHRASILNNSGTNVRTFNKHNISTIAMVANIECAINKSDTGELKPAEIAQTSLASKSGCKCSPCECEVCDHSLDREELNPCLAEKSNESKCHCSPCDCIVCDEKCSQSLKNATIEIHSSLLNQSLENGKRVTISSRQDKCSCDLCECQKCIAMETESDESIYPVKKAELLSPSLLKGKELDSYTSSLSIKHNLKSFSQTESFQSLYLDKKTQKDISVVQVPLQKQKGARTEKVSVSFKGLPANDEKKQTKDTKKQVPSSSRETDTPEGTEKNSENQSVVKNNLKPFDNASPNIEHTYFIENGLGVRHYYSTLANLSQIQSDKSNYSFDHFSNDVQLPNNVSPKIKHVNILLSGNKHSTHSSVTFENDINNGKVEKNIIDSKMYSGKIISILERYENAKNEFERKSHKLENSFKAFHDMARNHFKEIATHLSENDTKEITSSVLYDEELPEILSNDCNNDKGQQSKHLATLKDPKTKLELENKSLIKKLSSKSVKFTIKSPTKNIFTKDNKKDCKEKNNAFGQDHRAKLEIPLKQSRNASIDKEDLSVADLTIWPTTENKYASTNNIRQEIEEMLYQKSREAIMLPCFTPEEKGSDIGALPVRNKALVNLHQEVKNLLNMPLLKSAPSLDDLSKHGCIKKLSEEATCSLPVNTRLPFHDVTAESSGNMDLIGLKDSKRSLLKFERQVKKLLDLPQLKNSETQIESSKLMTDLNADHKSDPTV